MQLADESGHRALAYVQAATRHGGTLTTALLEEYVDHPTKKDAAYTSAALLQLANSIALNIPSVLKSEKTREAESVSQYLERLGWASIDAASSIRLTPLGESILTHLSIPPVDPMSEEPISVIVDPKDPLAYARIFNLVSLQSVGLLVDPYLKFPQLVDLSEVTAVRRILISDHDLSKTKPTFAHALSALADPPEVRYLPLQRLHDRFFISDQGQVLSFGSSLNSIAKRPGVITPITDATATEAIRQSYEKLWVEGIVIEPKGPQN